MTQAMTPDMQAVMEQARSATMQQQAGAVRFYCVVELLRMAMVLPTQDQVRPQLISMGKRLFDHAIEWDRVDMIRPGDAEGGKD